MSDRDEKLEETVWYYLDDGNQPVGPISTQSLQELLRSGELAKNVLVWAEKLNHWTNVSEVDELKGDLEKWGKAIGVVAESIKRPPPPPPPPPPPSIPPSSPEETGIISEELRQPEDVETAKPRPWIRFWARMIDVLSFTIVIVICAELIFPGSMDTPMLSNDLVAGFLILVLWVFVESIFLSTFGSTFGKWLLGVRLSKKSGERIGFPGSLARSARVFIVGLGLGLPIVTLVTQIVAYRKLMTNGETSWDKNGDFVVSHQKISGGRILGVIVTGMLIIAVIVIGIMEDSSY